MRGLVEHRGLASKTLASINNVRKPKEDASASVGTGRMKHGLSGMKQAWNTPAFMPLVRRTRAMHHLVHGPPAYELGCAA